jgi:elongation factor P
MSSLTEIKRGCLLKYNDKPHLVVDARFLRMQQRKPVMQTKLKNLITGQTVEYNFKQGEKIEHVEVAHVKVSYLYKEKDKYFFMDQGNYEQYELDTSIVGDKANYFKDSLEVDLVFYEGAVIDLQLPPKVELRVTQAPPGVKGDTAQGGFKPITLETGLVINAPLFINEGDLIRVNTETNDYVERIS